MENEQHVETLYYNLRKVKVKNQLGFIDELRTSGYVLLDAIDTIKISDDSEIPYAMDYQRYVLFRDFNAKLKENGRPGLSSLTTNDMLIFEFMFNDSKLTLNDQVKIFRDIVQLAVYGDASKRLIESRQEEDGLIEFYGVGDDEVDPYEYFGEILLAIAEPIEGESRLYIAASVLDFHELRVRAKLVVGGNQKREDLGNMLQDYLTSIGHSVQLLSASTTV